MRIVLVFALSLTCLANALASDQLPEQEYQSLEQKYVQKYYSVVMSAKEQKYSRKGGFVPDEQTAIAIAVAVWKPIFGNDNIENQKPWRAYLVNDTWIVIGSLPEGYSGGVAWAGISKQTGEILHVTHDK